MPHTVHINRKVHKHNAPSARAPDSQLTGPLLVPVCRAHGPERLQAALSCRFLKISSRDNSEIRAASGARIRQEALIAMKSGPAKLPVTKNPPVVAIIHDAGTSSRVPHAPPPAREVDPNEAADRRLRKFVQERSSANSSRARRKPKDEGGISDMIGMTANFFSSSITPKRREQHATTEDEAGTRL